MTARVISLQEKIAALERELMLRRRVYPGRVLGRFMTAATSAHELACMEAILQDYTTQRDAQQPDLFPMPAHPERRD